MHVEKFANYNFEIVLTINPTKSCIICFEKGWMVLKLQYKGANAIVCFMHRVYRIEATLQSEMVNLK